MAGVKYKYKLIFKRHRTLHCNRIVQYKKPHMYAQKYSELGSSTSIGISAVIKWPLSKRSL